VAFVALSAVAGLEAEAAEQADTLLNASYDLSREFYRDINAAFANFWRLRTGKDPEIRQSHAGSSVQARSIIDGLEADVVTFNQVTDIDALVHAQRVAPDWANRFPYHASPYRSVIAFVVRAGNPKGLRNWNDLLGPGTQIIVADPKTSGTARYACLGAYGYALRASGGNQKTAEQFMQEFCRHVPTLDTGSRGATTTFAAHETGDVLLTSEAEAGLIRSRFGSDKIDVVVPPLTMPVDFPVALVEPVVREHNNRQLAQAYLEFLFSTEAQEIAAKFHYRPNDPAVAAQFQERFQSAEFIDVDQAFGGWGAVQQMFFADEGLFHRIWNR
jgi:sulfate/thiosulfate-binding protein